MTNYQTHRMRNRMLEFLLVFVVINLISVPLLQDQSEPVTILIFSIVAAAGAAQLGLLAIWGVFARQTVGFRTLVSFALLAALLLSMMAGAVAVTPEISRAPLSGLFGVAPLLALLLFVTQIPLWMLRYLTRARIIRADDLEHEDATQRQQFRLLHVFGATTLVAILLAGVQWSLHAGNDGGSSRNEPLVALLPALIALIVCLIFALLVVVPILFAVLGSVRLHRGLTFLAVYLGIITTVIAIPVALMYFYGRAIDEEKMVIWFFPLLFSILTGVLTLFRYWGYSLDWSLPWRRPSTTTVEKTRTAEDAVKIATVDPLK